MSSDLYNRLTIQAAYLRQQPRGASYDAMKQETLDLINDGDITAVEIPLLINLGLSAPLAAALPRVKGERIAGGYAGPLRLLQLSPEGIEDTKEAIRLLAPFVPADASIYLSIAIDYSQRFDMPELIGWMSRAIHPFDIAELLPRALLVGAATADNGSRCPRHAAWLAEQISVADLSHPCWHSCLEKIVTSGDHRTNLLLLRVNPALMRRLYLSRSFEISNAGHLLEVVSRSRHLMLKLFSTLPENILAMDEVSARQAILNQYPSTSPHMLDA